MTRLGRFAPLIGLAIFLVAVIWRLATPVDTNVTSKLDGTPVPAFAAVVAAPSKPAFSSRDLATGQPRLVNFFASWCVPCIAEAKMLNQLKERGVAIDGIAVRDRPEDVAAFLARVGDPYRAITADTQSRIQISLGSSGVPETFVIDGRGIIRYQHIGPIEQADVPVILARLEAAK